MVWPDRWYSRSPLYAIVARSSGHDERQVISRSEDRGAAFACREVAIGLAAAGGFRAFEG